VQGAAPSELLLDVALAMGRIYIPIHTDIYRYIPIWLQGAAPSEMLLDVALAKGAEDGVEGEGGYGGGGEAGDVTLESKLSMDEEEEDYDLLLANTGVGGASKGPPRVLRFVDFYIYVQN